MSTEEPLSRKDKKAQRDAERRNKGKKRKHDETEEQEGAEAQPDAALPSDTADKEKSAIKKSKKRKSGDIEDGTVDVSTKNDDTTEAAKRPKKKRKKTQTESTSNTADGEEQTTPAKDKPTKSRFILFIGNLSFKTTDETLRAHFKKLEPFTLRHLTDPKTKRSKGCAFIEFENYDRMKTCLKLYHHSIFDPTKKDQPGPEPVNEGAATKTLGKDARKINVELTAGGGGKTEGRKEKIKMKNTRLEEQRKRRAEAERKERAKKEKKEGTKGKNDGAADEQEKEKQMQRGAEENESHGIHPSRLARIQT